MQECPRILWAKRDKPFTKWVFCTDDHYQNATLPDDHYQLQSDMVHVYIQVRQVLAEALLLKKQQWGSLTCRHFYQAASTYSLHDYGYRSAWGFDHATGPRPPNLRFTKAANESGSMDIEIILPCTCTCNVHLPKMVAIVIRTPLLYCQSWYMPACHVLLRCPPFQAAI